MTHANSYYCHAGPRGGRCVVCASEVAARRARARRLDRRCAVLDVEAASRAAAHADEYERWSARLDAVSACDPGR